MAQVVARLDDELATAIDRLVLDGVVASRSMAVREGLALLLERHDRERTAAAIVDGYTRMPQREAEVGWPDAATRRMIDDEPW